MNEITTITTGGPVTMSSREIAELTGKRHDHVLRDIERMILDIGDPKFGASSFEAEYTTPQNKRAKEYRLPKDLTVTLVTGYRADLRYKVVKKLEELEKGSASVALNDPAMLRHLLLENVEKVLALEAEVKELVPLANSYEHLTRHDGTLCITDAAKALDMRPKDLFAWLQANKWIYRRAGNGHWVGYQQRIQAGLLDHRLEEVTRADGSSKITEQVRVTAKGMGRLGELLAPEMA